MRPVSVGRRRVVDGWQRVFGWHARGTVEALRYPLTAVRRVSAYFNRCSGVISSA